MIIPIIYSLNPIANNQMFTWTFIKAVSFAKNYNWPVIAQEQYFSNISSMEGFFSENLIKHFEYTSLVENDLNKIKPIIIPKEIEKEYLSKFPSQTDAYMFSIQNDWTEMENYLEEQITAIEQETGEKVEAFMTLPNVKFLENVSEKLDIPVFHFEWGPFRPKAYRKTAYLDFENIVTGLKPRYETFIAEGLDKKLPIFTRNELLAIFLEKDYLKYAVDQDRVPTYELGIASGYTTIGEYSAHNMVSLVETHTKSLQHFNENDICWRFHPEDPLHSKIGAKNLSEHESTIEFILECKRVVSLSSNMIYEAMLYNRLGYDIGFSHYSFEGNSSLDKLEDKEASIEFLNYVAFAYLIPYEFLNSLDYLRFRLRKPSEEEIYNYHLEYYLNTIGLDKNILEVKGKERLNLILSAKGYEEEIKQVTDYEEHAIWFDSSEYARNYIKIERLKKKNNDLQLENIGLLEQVEQINQMNTSLIEKNASLMNVIDALSGIKSNLILLQSINSWKASRLLRKAFQRSEKSKVDIDRNIANHIDRIGSIISEAKNMRIAVLYLDYGNGYSEENKLVENYTIIDGIHHVQFDVPEDVKAIRYDPCECGEKALYYDMLRVNDKEMAYSEYNIKEVNNKKTFLLRNPFFLIETVEKIINISIRVTDM